MNHEEMDMALIVTTYIVTFMLFLLFFTSL